MTRPASFTPDRSCIFEGIRPVPYAYGSGEYDALIDRALQEAGLKDGVPHPIDWTQPYWPTGTWEDDEDEYEWVLELKSGRVDMVISLFTQDRECPLCRHVLEDNEERDSRTLVTLQFDYDGELSP